MAHLRVGLTLEEGENPQQMQSLFLKMVGQRGEHVLQLIKQLPEYADSRYSGGCVALTERGPCFLEFNIRPSQP